MDRAHRSRRSIRKASTLRTRPIRTRFRFATRRPRTAGGRTTKPSRFAFAATAHYGSFDQTGDARRTIRITNDLNGGDPDLLPGFPLNLGTSAEEGAKLADIDGDGVSDIVYGATDGTLHVYTMKGGVPAEAAGFPFRTVLIDGLNPAITDPLVPSYATAPGYQVNTPGAINPDVARETIGSAPAIGDIDGDGKPEIVFATWDGTLYAIDHTGKLLTGFPHRLPLVPSCPLNPATPKPTGDCMDLYHALARGAYAAPVLVDLDKDGKPTSSSPRSTQTFTRFVTTRRKSRDFPFA